MAKQGKVTKREGIMALIILALLLLLMPNCVGLQTSAGGTSGGGSTTTVCAPCDCDNPCPDGEFYSNIQNRCLNCPPNSYYDTYSDRCVCVDDYLWSESTETCVPPSSPTDCPDGYFYDTMRGDCYPEGDCPENAYFDTMTEECVCYSGYVYDEKYGVCIEEWWEL